MEFLEKIKDPIEEGVESKKQKELDKSERGTGREREKREKMKHKEKESKSKKEKKHEIKALKRKRGIERKIRNQRERIE